MSENINFIPANQLPEADGDNVSVLCVENGELKQKAASGLSGNVNYDIVVRITTAWLEEDGRGYPSATGEILSGSYDAVIQKLNNGIVPIGLCISGGALYGGGGEYKAVEEFFPYQANMLDEFGECIIIDAYEYGFALLPDGTIRLD